MGDRVAASFQLASALRQVEDLPPRDRANLRNGSVTKIMIETNIPDSLL